MSQTQDALQAKLKSLSPAQREALLKKLKQQKSAKGPARSSLRDQPIAKLDRTHKDYPLSFAQQRLWFLEQLNPGSAAYNIAAAFRLQGQLNRDILNQTFRLIIQRHESLRTVFYQSSEGARQRVLEHLHWELDCTDLRQHPAAVQQAIHEDANSGLDLACGPLLRARLLQTGDSEHILTIVMHHIISDAWSTQVLMAEASRIYNTLKQGAAIALPAPRIQYIDYTAWQQQLLQEDDAKQQLSFWREQLADCANLNLATDKPRPNLQTSNGSFYRLQLPAELCQRLQQLCQQQGTTLFSGLLTAFECLLYRYSQQTDFAIGTPVAGRNHDNLNGLIGFFVNTLALKADIAPQDSFSKVLEKVKKTTLKAQSQQDIPFEKLVDELKTARDGSYTPVFQSFFSYTPGQADQQLQLDGIDVSYLPADTDTAKFDLSLIVNDAEAGLICHFEYNTDLFVEATIEQMAQHFQQLLQAAISQPEQPIEQLAMLSGSEQQQRILHGHTQPAAEKTIIELFEQQAEKHPQHVAVKQGEDSLSFAELNRQANQLAHYLITQGVKPGDYIGLCFPPCLELAVALLATVKAGAAYVPMDPSYPAERLAYMVENAGIEQLLSLSRIDTQAVAVRHNINIDTLALAEQPGTNPGIICNSCGPLYVIYTSGSTGLPKAAVVSHGGESNLLAWYSSEYHLQAADKLLVFSAIGFDLTQKNLWLPLCYGAQLHFSATEWYEPESLLGTIAAEGISWINCAPSAFYPLVDNCRDFKQLASLQKVFFGGEPIRLNNLQPWLQHADCTASITNMYGPTECTDIACSYTLTNTASHQGSIPIGSPSANCELYILDQHQQLLPRGAVGELYIGGAGVGLGYLHNPAMTAERFIANPVSGEGTLYRTGDLVRERLDGELEFIARCDDQIKIRGFRIELGEIESQLKQLDGIEEAVVHAQEFQGQPQLIAFICSQQPLADNNHYKRRLKQHLPDYMVPTAFFAIDTIPLTPNGKVDRKKLPQIDLTELKQTEFVAPRNPCEEELAIIWQRLLGIEQVGVHDNFFELGGHSLLATQMLTRIREAYDIELPLRTIFEVSTVAGIAEIISAMFPNELEDSCDDDEAFEEGIL